MCYHAYAWTSVSELREMGTEAGTITCTRARVSAAHLRWDRRYEDEFVKKRIILVVEDSPTDEALLVRALNKAGVTNPIVTVKDGLEALDYLYGTGRYEFQKAEEVPAVVLIDLNLPKLDGLEVLRRMRADYRTKLVPVAIFTS